MNTRIFNIVALLLLVLFFAPYVLKVKQLDLIVILLIGLAMPIYDFMSNQEDKKE